MLAVALESVDDTINARAGWPLLSDCASVNKSSGQNYPSYLRAKDGLRQNPMFAAAALLGFES